MVKRFIRYYKPHLALFYFDMFCALCIAGIDLLFPVVTREILNNYLKADKMDLVLYIGATLLIFYIIRFIFAFIIGYYGHIMGIRLETDMRSDLFKKYQELDYEYFDDKKTGTLMTNLTTHLHDVSEMSHHAPEDLFISGIMLIGSFIILTFINYILTLIVFVFLIFLVMFSISRRKKMLNAFRISRNAQSELNSQVESSLGGIRLTKAFNNEETEIEKFEVINGLFKQSRVGNFKQIGLFGSGNDFFINLTNLALLIVGGFFVYYDIIDYVDLTTYFLFINFLIKPIGRLTASMEQLQQGFSGVEKFFQVMDTQPMITSKDDAIVKEDFKGLIEFEDVSFHYQSNEDNQVLQNFSLVIEPGKKIALVGETGVGKTTISKLVPRFYDVSGGAIYVDGINVKDYDLYNLRNAIGHVQQDVFIFYGTLYDNIVYGKPTATKEEVIEAAKLAQIHDFVMTLDEEYDTLVGERGVKLSGGQKQRIAIARLFLKDPKILILDEATSSLDNITENYIQTAFDKLAVNKTTIIIAHRLSTIKNADEIIVIGRNGIIERGKHEELLKNNGYYASLYTANITI